MIPSVVVRHFNPLASERRDGWRTSGLRTIHHFNPLASERRDHRGTPWYTMVQISIHSPLRGETKAQMAAEKYAAISIHSPLRGETANGHKNCLQRSFILHRSPPHKSNKRDFQQKKEPFRRKKQHTLGANPSGIWCELTVRIKESTVHPPRERAIRHSARPYRDSGCPAHRNGRCRAPRPFRRESGA